MDFFGMDITMDSSTWEGPSPWWPWFFFSSIFSYFLKSLINLEEATHTQIWMSVSEIQWKFTESQRLTGSKLELNELMLVPVLFYRIFLLLFALWSIWSDVALLLCTGHSNLFLKLMDFNREPKFYFARIIRVYLFTKQSRLFVNISVVFGFRENFSNESDLFTILWYVSLKKNV